MENEQTVEFKLLKVQTGLKAPKNQFNKFGNYNYRSCEDILEGLKPLMDEIGFCVKVSDEVVLIGERYYIKATAKFLTSGGGCIEATALAREPLMQKGMNEAQITGSASSYARKYALNGLFCIDDNKDADSQKPVQNANQKPKNAPPQRSTPPHAKCEIDAIVETALKHSIKTERPPSEKQIETLRSLFSKMNNSEVNCIKGGFLGDFAVDLLIKKYSK